MGASVEAEIFGEKIVLSRFGWSINSTISMPLSGQLTLFSRHNTSGMLRIVGEREQTRQLNIKDIRCACISNVHVCRISDS